MNIALASDENYAKFLTIAVVSIMESNKTSDITFYIIDSGMLSKSKAYLESKVGEYHNSITFIKAEDLMGKLKVDNSFSIASYSRLFLTSIPNIDRIIYLDCDSVVVGDLEELWETDISGYLFAGVIDPVSLYYREAIGLSKDDPYINAGVLSMNLAELRMMGWEEKVLSFIEKFYGSVPHHDQGIINGLARGRIKIVPPKFNAMDVYYMYTPPQMEKLAIMRLPYSNEEYYGARNNPIFIHFTSGFYGRVWDVKCRHPRKDLFRNMLRLSGYEEEKILIDKPENKNAVIMQRLYKILPFGIYCIVNQIAAERKKRLRGRK